MENEKHSPKLLKVALSTKTIMGKTKLTFNEVCDLSSVENTLPFLHLINDFRFCSKSTHRLKQPWRTRIKLRVRGLFRGDRSPFSPHNRCFSISLKINTPNKTTMADSDMTLKYMCEVSSVENILPFLHIIDVSRFRSKSTHRLKRPWRTRI